MKKGTTYIITTGEHSDYGIYDCFVALQDFSFDRKVDEWLVAHPSKRGPRHFPSDGQGDYQAFLVSLRTEGLVADASPNKVHLCNYSVAETAPANDAGDAS